MFFTKYYLERTSRIRKMKTYIFLKSEKKFVLDNVKPSSPISFLKKKLIEKYPELVNVNFSFEFNKTPLPEYLCLTELNLDYTNVVIDLID